ncbi:MAG: sulfatase-like hydrolase/transferase [Limisphaerales bacterium]
MKPTLVCLSALVLAVSPLPAADAPKPSTRANILLILADDLGYADLGCQGSPDVKTPNIDSLAANGVRCTAGYVTAPQCSPSRAGLLSGRYQQRFGHEGNPNFPVMLMHGGRTMADHLKAAGYAAGHFGKWHLGFSDMGTAPKEIREGRDQMLPTQHGFDESFGYGDYERVAKKGSDIAPAPHAHDDRVFARKAADFIGRHQAAPWFVYLALHAPHTQQVDFGDYRARFPNAPKERLGVLSVMAQQDEAVGTVLARLRELNQEENTLVFFISDNGGTRRGEGEAKHFTGSLNTPFSGDKGTVLEGGIRVPFLMQWRGTLPAGKTYDRPIISLDVLPTALAAAGARPLTETALDGVNLLPFLKAGQSGDPHSVLFWRWRTEQAVRQGDWKLVRGKEHREWRLIDLSKDVRESTDLTQQQPAKAKELRELHERWAAGLPPVGPSFKDTTEGDDGDTDKQTRRKTK